MIRFLAAGAVALALVGTGAAVAQDQTLADIRQELTVLNVEVQKLRRELSTTGTVNTSLGGGDTLARLDAIELELRRLTGKTEELEFRIDVIVRDGTNRIGDLEFRLVELEGGDVTQLGQTSTLGGGAAPETAAVAPAPQAETQLAEQEKADFERAQEALAARDFRAAADQFAAFNETYPGGPLAKEVELRRGQALEGLGDVREAARAYLSAFTLGQQSTQAPEALYRLGAALGRLGQSQEACVTLSEVAVRYPTTPFIADAEAARQNIGCS
ncbi:tetratricopeptide repeat protein [Tateyamaria sp.]|uniref:tetratricopeptide repeat protein n=1 Tax=Tateyamaria sp. TaxID=1929288 RepID=UPI003B21AD1A